MQTLAMLLRILRLYIFDALITLMGADVCLLGSVLGLVVGLISNRVIAWCPLASIHPQLLPGLVFVHRKNIKLLAVWDFIVW